jgi:hypothetical protein
MSTTAWMKLEFLKQSALGGQLLEREYWGRNHMTQGVQEQIGILPAVEAEGHFLAVGLEMLRADFMPRAHNSALEKRECGFNGIGVNVALGIDAELVANRLVPPVFSQMLRRAPVCFPIVREQNIDILADILADVLFERSALGVRGMEESQVAATLTDSDNDFFVIVFRGLSLPPILAANVSFVHFDFAAEHRPVHFDHRRADPVTEIPCCPVASDSQRPLHLTSRHALLGFAKQQGSEEPFIQGEMAVIENSSSGDGELVVALLAVKQLPLGLKLNDWHFAAQTLDAFGPAKSDKHLSALFIGREHGVYIN